MEKIKKALRMLIFTIKYVCQKLTGGIELTGNGKKSRMSRSCDFNCDSKSKIILGKIDAYSNTHLGAVNGGELKIGDNVFFNRNCIVVSMESVKVGDNCRFGPNVCVYDHDHTFGKAKANGEKFKTAPVEIGNGCWIGANAVILRGSNIGDNCVIGAGCVVSGEIPANSLVKSNRENVIESIR